MRILVTGSEGNIGRKLIPYLELCGHKVLGCDIVPKYARDYVQCDIGNPTDLISVFSLFRPEAVINLAAMYGRVTCERSPATTMDVNISGMNNVLQLCKMFSGYPTTGCPQIKFIYFSTSEVYGNSPSVKSEDDTQCCPNNIYGLSKYMGEQLVRYEVGTHCLAGAIIRPFTIYDEDETRGEHRSAIIRFAEQLYRGNKIEVHKDSSRSWLHISDAVVIIEKILHLENFEIINIGSSETIETARIAQIMCEALGRNYADFVVEVEQPGQMSLTKIPNLTKQSLLLGYSPRVGIADGIKMVIERMKKRLS